MKSNLKIFAKKLAFFLAIIYLLDFCTGSLLKYLFFKHEPVVNESVTYVLKYSKEDILIIGPSHAHMHYMPGTIADSLKMSCYNAGSDGHYILCSYALLKGVLKRYVPKMIILDIRSDEFNTDVAGYDRLSIFLPFYDSEPDMRPIIEERSKFEKYKLLSKTYPYNSQILSIINRNVHKNKYEFKARPDLGFESNNDTIEVKALNRRNEYYKNKAIDNNFVNAYRLFLKECIKNHIKLYVFISPLIPETHIKLKSLEIATKIADSLHVPFFNYSNDKRFKKREYYHDIEHLNLNGARIYTREVINTIRNN